MPQCDGCTMCCKLMGIPELKKPAGKWCDHCAIGTGCKIYEERPTSCVDFECMYRASPIDLPIELRPDKCKCVIAPATDPNVVAVQVDPGYPDAWKKEPVNKMLTRLAESGFTVVIGTCNSLEKVLLERAATGIVRRRYIKMTPPDEDGMQWYDTATERVG